LNTAPGHLFITIATELNQMKIHHPKKRFHDHPDLFDWGAQQDFRAAHHAVRWVASRGRVPLSTAQTISELAGITTWERR